MKSNKIKIFSVLAISAMLFACGGQSSSSESKSNSSSVAGTTSSVTTSATESVTSDEISTSSATSEVTTSEDDSSSIEEDVEPEPVARTIAELIASPETSTANVYEVEGVWHPTKGDTDEYGNGYLYDPETGNYIVVYGMAAAKEVDGTKCYTYANGAFSFSNPKNYLTAYKTSFNAGDKIKLVLFAYSTKYSNYTGSYFVSKIADASTISYSVTTGTIENGEVAVSATSGVYGETITVTPSAATGYKVDTVSVNGKAITPNDGTYSFTVMPGTNEVTATFVSESAVATSFEITAANLLDYSGTSVSYVTEDKSKTISDGSQTLDITYIGLACYGDGIQSRIKNNVSGCLYNTSACDYEIASITIVANAKWTSTSSTMSVAFGTEAIATAPATYTGTLTNATFTVTNTVSDAKYFRLDQTVSGAIYIDSITINYVVA